MTVKSIVTLENEDKTQVTIHHSLLGESRVASMALRSYADLIDSGMNLGHNIGIGNTTTIVWAEIDGFPIGGMCYAIRPEISTCWIIFSFVRPDWRGKGVNLQCRLILENLMRSQDVKYMASYVSTKNERMIQIALDAGFQPSFYRMHKKL
jgi:GNAT superfamily N-acetyltransferase